MGCLGFGCWGAGGDCREDRKATPAKVLAAAPTKALWAMTGLWVGGMFVWLVVTRQLL